MNFSSPSPQVKQVLHWVIPFGITCFVIIGIVAGTVFFYAQHYTDKIVAGVSVASIPLDGLSPAEARTRIQAQIDQALAQGVVFRYQEKDMRLLSSKDQPLIQFDTDGAVDTAFRIGRSSNAIQNAFLQLDARLRHRNLSLNVDINDQQAEEKLRYAFQSALQPAADAELLISKDVTSERYLVSTSPEHVGKDMDVERALTAFKKQAQMLSFPSPIILAEITTHPTRTQTDIQPLVPQAQAWMDHTPFTVTNDTKKWAISSEQFAHWLRVTSHPDGWQLDLDQTAVTNDLNALLVDVLKPAQDGHLVVQDGKMVEFTAPIEGLQLNATATIALLKDHQQTAVSSTKLVLTQVAPRILGDGESLGIRETVGVGRSEFDGSPSNRRKNIALGAKKVHGTLIPPGGEFSLLKALGEIDGAHGWLPELVIKGDKTTPEFGGGLCQIGTTAFRAALNSGLLITERRNHSYRVRYYEPAGTDATIYDPAPDFRFKNDTAHWMLLTSEIKGDVVTFTYWGTRDGRVVEQTTPRVYNIVAAPPTKKIETLDLAPGKMKCTEVAHAGADASFDYTVTHPNQEPTKVTFNSRYKPWGAVCLVGVAQLSSDTTNTASTTQPLIP